MFDPICMALCGGGSGSGIPVVDMSDVLIHSDGSAQISLTAEQCERIGLDAAPKLVWMIFYDGLKTMVLLTPQIEPEADGFVAYGGVAVIENSVHFVWAALSTEGGTVFMGVSS